MLVGEGKLRFLLPQPNISISWQRSCWLGEGASLPPTTPTSLTWNTRNSVCSRLGWELRSPNRTNTISTFMLLVGCGRAELRSSPNQPVSWKVKSLFGWEGAKLPQPNNKISLSYIGWWSLLGLRTATPNLYMLTWNVTNGWWIPLYRQQRTPFPRYN